MSPSPRKLSYFTSFSILFIFSSTYPPWPSFFSMDLDHFTPFGTLSLLEFQDAPYSHDLYGVQATFDSSLDVQANIFPSISYDSLGVQGDVFPSASDTTLLPCATSGTAGSFQGITNFGDPMQPDLRGAPPLMQKINNPFMTVLNDDGRWYTTLERFQSMSFFGDCMQSDLRAPSMMQNMNNSSLTLLDDSGNWSTTMESIQPMSFPQDYMQSDLSGAPSIVQSMNCPSMTSLDDGGSRSSTGMSLNVVGSFGDCMQLDLSRAPSVVQHTENPLLASSDDGRSCTAAQNFQSTGLLGNRMNANLSREPPMIQQINWPFSSFGNVMNAGVQMSDTKASLKKGHNMYKRRVNKRAWSLEEDRLLSRLVAQYGPKNWSHIACLMKRRKGKQCRERWVNHLRPGINKADVWSEEEDRMLVHLHSLYGPKWKKIAEGLPGRPENTIKNHWNTTFRSESIRRMCQSSKHPKNDRRKSRKDTPLQNYMKTLPEINSPMAPAVATTTETWSKVLKESKASASTNSRKKMDLAWKSVPIFTPQNEMREMEVTEMIREFVRTGKAPMAYTMGGIPTQAGAAALALGPGLRGVN